MNTDRRDHSECNPVSHNAMHSEPFHSPERLSLSVLGGSGTRLVLFSSLRGLKWENNSQWVKKHKLLVSSISYLSIGSPPLPRSLHQPCICLIVCQRRKQTHGQLIWFMNHFLRHKSDISDVCMSQQKHFSFITSCTACRRISFSISLFSSFYLYVFTSSSDNIAWRYFCNLKTFLHKLRKYIKEINYFPHSTTHMHYFIIGWCIYSCFLMYLIS